MNSRFKCIYNKDAALSITIKQWINYTKILLRWKFRIVLKFHVECAASMLRARPVHNEFYRIHTL